MLIFKVCLRMHCENLWKISQLLFTFVELLKRKDEEISQALVERNNILADIFEIPHNEFDNIAEVIKSLMMYVVGCASVFLIFVQNFFIFILMSECIKLL